MKSPGRGLQVDDLNTEIRLGLEDNNINLKGTVGYGGIIHRDFKQDVPRVRLRFQYGLQNWDRLTVKQNLLELHSRDID
ncbi:MAG: hypothetical protein GWO19_16925, partial [Nitrospinaceae bacterium]|nr:hypothetical protein [Nitrospinaceae bacterium]NIU97679.1 hypothetical protein [Nitrospinaceae bacterium]NIW60263.1 hypothetical protein [Nitrospinaceae bacterium]